MNFITDYQLDIDKGFMCKVNGIAYQFDFKYSTRKYLYYVSNILKLADFLEIDRSELKGIFNNETAYDVIYCDSKQECYDLCQHIVKTYFKPVKDYRDIVSFRCGNESYKFELTVLAGKFMWRNAYDDSTPLINKNQVDVQKVKDELSIKIYTLAHCDSFGFDSREDALKFAKWVKETLYDKQEVCEKPREQLKHYYHGAEQVNFPNSTFILKQFRAREYFWSGANPNVMSKDLYKQFELSADQTLAICNKLKLHAYFVAHTLLFGDRKDAIKFTDYLIETYIIKKEKTYDTNQLRKERTAISRGAKPAGSIIHGRRGKASIRRGCIKHQTCIGC